MTMQSYVAGADIEVCRFVKVSANFTVIKCVAGEQAAGVSQEGSGTPPIPGASALAALNGMPLKVYGQGDTCEIEVGAAVTAGQFVKPDANARAVPAVATDKYSGRVIRGQSVVGDRCQIELISGIV